MRPLLVFGTTLLAVSALACSSTEPAPPVDASVVHDGGLAVDGGFVGADAGESDAGARGIDAGAADIDAGTRGIDAGVVEAAPVAVVSGAELVALVAAQAVQVVDVRGAGAFGAGHVPGAVRLPTGGLRTTVDGVPSQVLPRAAAEEIFEGAGIDARRRLVVVGSGNDTGTARAMWTLAFYGVENVAVLDGGYPAWLAAGGEASTVDAAGRSTWTDAPTREALRTDKAWLLEHYEDADVAIFDVRSSGEYAAGHIPGAISANWTENLRPDGLFDDPETIRAYHGDPRETTLVVYCQSGARASVSWTLLKAVGYEDVRLYDGSWNEWGADPSTPKETGN